ncbi:MAG: cyclophilin-like fold protein [Nitrospira sp.]|nr:cyclophilin-like fold protein [Nitrospira sp.]
MIRLGIILAMSSAQGACSAETVGSDPLASENRAIVVTNSEVGSTASGFVERSESTMSKIEIGIVSDQRSVTAELVDNAATQALLRMLPLTIEMHDHLRQEKTGNLPAPLPEVERQQDFSAGTLGIWGNDDFVIFYRDGRVPAPGIIVIGRVTGDVTIFDHPGSVTVRIERAE